MNFDLFSQERHEGEIVINSDDNRKLGQLDYIVSNPRSVIVNLVSVKFHDQTDRVRFDINSIKEYFEKKSMCQLLVNYTFKSINYDSDLMSNSFWTEGDDNEIEGKKLVDRMYNAIANEFQTRKDINISNSSEDYYFLIDIEMPCILNGKLYNKGSSALEGKLSSQVQGGHYVGKNGGIQPKADEYCETFSHEFGHGLGFRHPFEYNFYFKRSKPKLDGKGYYMDYDITRSYWYKYEFNIVNENSDGE